MENKKLPYKTLHVAVSVILLIASPFVVAYRAIEYVMSVLLFIFTGKLVQRREKLDTPKIITSKELVDKAIKETKHKEK